MVTIIVRISMVTKVLEVTTVLKCESPWLPLFYYYHVIRVRHQTQSTLGDQDQGDGAVRYRIRVVVAPLSGCDQGKGAVRYSLRGAVPLWVIVIRVTELSSTPPLPLWVTVIRLMELSGIAPCPHWVTVIRVMEQSGSHPVPSGWL